MKKMSGEPVTLRLLSVLMVSVLFGSAAARGDVVLDCAIAVNTAVANKQNPFAQARYAAIMQLAVFEAVNCSLRSTHPNSSHSCLDRTSLCSRASAARGARLHLRPSRPLRSRDLLSCSCGERPLSRYRNDLILRTRLLSDFRPAGPLGGCDPPTRCSSSSPNAL